EKITSGEFNLIVDSKSAILIGIGIILIDALSAYSIVRTDKKTTGGMYSDYKIEINEDEINIEYESKTKNIKKSEIEKIKLSKLMIIINFGNKDINITMSKYFFKNYTEFKALRKLLEKYNAKKINKDLFG
ncbi:MAG: hypothetical protein PHU94_05605, partial [Bacilli bacterium]|nr:hypothetical protein [Bacilli bacterium]MDD4734459.1 hypothetical protein [Bacilli bacterium]